MKKNFFCFLLTIFFGCQSHALIVRLSDLHTMAKRSDIVIYGYVGDQQVITDDMSRLITLTKIEVIDGIHGAKTGEVITVYQVGGQKDGIVSPLLGGHQYNFGQELILFGLKLDDTYVSYGAGQGKLDIVHEMDAEKVVEDLGNVSAINMNAAEHSRLYQPTPLTFESKRVLIDEIRQMVKSR